MPSKPGSRERNYGYKSAPRDNKMGNRPRSNDLYHTSRWTKESRAFRRSYPLCEHCKKEGKIVPADVTDHIIPFPVCPDFWDMNNWQALCNRCNIQKGLKDKELINNYKAGRG